MRGPLPRLLALPLTTAVLLLPVAPALADDDDDSTIPTTPVPETKGEAPASSPKKSDSTAHAVGAAGTALGVLRLLPESQDTDTIMPGFSDELGKQAAFEAGISLTNAKANSEAYLSYERSTAEACPGGVAVGGDSPQTPGCVSQTALPDNEKASTAGLDAPDNPLLDVGLLDGKAHARWDRETGPCVDPLADSSESVANLSLFPELPSMDDIGKLSDSSDKLADALDNMGPLSTLGGLLPGKEAAEKDDDAGGLVSLPNTMSTHSNVSLVDAPDSDNKAVRSTSTLQLADAHLFEGTPLELDIKVASQPTLTVTSTGDADTSSVDYEAPVLKVYRDGEKLYTLDADHPTKNIGMGVPSDPEKLADSLGLPSADDLKDTPVLGGLVETVDDGVKSLSDDEQGMVLDLFAVKLSIADLDVKKKDKDKPFDGYQIGASARMMNVDILPTDRLTEFLPKDVRDDVPDSLAQVAFGEQVARSYAPDDGVVCGAAGNEPPGEKGGGGKSPGTPDQLAQTSAAYASVPLFWGGAGLLLAGVVMVSALPNRRVRSGPKPSPRPRE